MFAKIVLYSFLRNASAVLNEGSECIDITGTTELGAYTRSFAVMDSGGSNKRTSTMTDTFIPLNGDVAGTCVVTDNSMILGSRLLVSTVVIKNAVKLAWSPKKAQDIV